MQTHQFTLCCTARELGGFWNTTSKREIQTYLDDDPAPLYVATWSSSQNTRVYKNLLASGFEDMGTYPGHGGTIHLLVKGLTKPRARSKRETK